MAVVDESKDPFAAQSALFEPKVERIRELNERLLQTALDAGARTLDSYERALQDLAAVTVKDGGATPLEWLTALAQVQANFVREVTLTYTAALRVLLD
jgi:hypothetical protein